MKYQRFIIILFLVIAFITTPPRIVQLSEEEASAYLPAVKNLKTGWRGETLYQTQPLGPISICETPTDVLVLDKAGSTILDLENTGATSLFASTGNLSFNAIEYQPNNARIIAMGDRAFFVFKENSFRVLNEYPPTIQFSTFTIDSSDDSIYTGFFGNDSTIYHFNASGYLLGAIQDHVQGCAQIALHPDNTRLYYSETYTGTIMENHLLTNTSTMLTSNIGIPGTGEGIGVTIDNNGSVYYYVAEGNGIGLYKYHEGIFTHVSGPKSGIGPIFWSNNFQAVLCAAGAGACIVKYDLTQIKPELLTPTVGTRAIIETVDGRVFIGVDNFIYELIGTELAKFSPPLPGVCSSLILTNAGEIFVGVQNDSLVILKLELNGTYSIWFDENIEGFLQGIVYDRMSHALIISVEKFTTDTVFWRIPIEDPTNYQKIFEIENRTRISFTLDFSGNLYLLERMANILYKLPYGLSEIEILFTNFVEAAYLVQPNLGYSSIEDGIILCRNDDLQVWPISSEKPFVLAENYVGIDNDGVFENINQELICTHSGQIFKLIYDEILQNSTEITEGDSTSTTNPSSSISGELCLVIFSLLVLFRKRKIIK